MAYSGRLAVLSLAALALPSESCTSDCAAPCPAGQRCIVISELSAAGSALTDEDATVQDWIELHNQTDRAVRIEGYTLTDDPRNVPQWVIPTCEIGPREFLVIFASRKDRVGDELHTSFELDADGEYLALIRPDGATVESQFAPAYPAQYEGISYGREFVDGSPTDRTLYFPTPTPGAPNGPGTDSFGRLVEFDPPSGTFTGALDVMLRVVGDDGEDDEIRYTLDGSMPDETSPRASSSIRLEAATTVRARSFHDGFGGPVTSATYLAVHEELERFDSNLPVVVARVVDVVNEDHAIYTDGTIATFEPGGDGRARVSDAPSWAGMMALRRRGYTSSYFPKVQYGMETRDASHQDLDVPFLGMPAEADWVLNAPYSDKSLLRIHFSMNLARRMGHWAPRTRMFELFLAEGDGVVGMEHYVGVYVLLEKLKRSRDRVDIERLSPADEIGEALTGGYIVALDRADPGDSGFWTRGGAMMAFVEPNESELTQPQRDYIVGYVEDIERRLERSDFGGYEEVLDVEAFIDHHLLIEMTRNVDGLRLSTFMHKDRGGRLVMGPAWDYNLSLGNSFILAGWTTDGWQHAHFDETPPATSMCNCPVTTSRDCEVGCAPLWMSRLFDDPVFRDRYRARWAELRAGALSDAEVLGELDAAIANVSEAQARNFARWPVLGVRLFGNTFVFPTWEEEIAFLRDFVVDRLAWMDSQLL